jgi:aspartyl-tRNA(Asn)/glutamyl-tRNA(Gln) amidotransferase subunit B
MTYLIQGYTEGEWEVVIGLEVHAQIISESKLFSGASTEFGADPNSQVSFIDAAFPGMLPVLNKVCVEQAVKTGLGLNATINLVSQFDRKNYFYPDLPQGYQITQLHHPIIGKGEVEIELEDRTTKMIGITRLHIEQDAGKSIHDAKTRIDLNRAGIGLMEIVSEPDMRSPHEAGAYVRKLRSIMRYLGTCDGNMEEGSLRADVNVSVRHPGEALRTRCEIKNVNSIRFIMQAVEYEALRQIEVWESSEEVKQQSRTFDNGVTRPMREKEDAHDYRYFPDPDLLPLKLEQAWVDNLRANLPELPDAKKARFMKDYGLTIYDAGVLVSEQAIASFYETVARGRDPKLAANWVTGDFFAALNRLGYSIEHSPVSADNLGKLLDLITDGTINGNIAKTVFERMLTANEEPGVLVDALGLRQNVDTGAIDAAVEKVIADNPDKMAEYQSGKERLFGFFVGQVMKAMGGKANPALVNEALRRRMQNADTTDP